LNANASSTDPSALHPDERWPVFSERVFFQAKAALLRIIRAGRDALDAPKNRRSRPVAFFCTGLPLAESRSPLWDHAAPRVEQVLNAGKIQNLRVAGRRLDGCVFAPGQGFSFWRQVGWPGRLRGFVRGRELRQGCLVPSTGGGLCQLSNALYDCAVKAGFSIVERHRHSRLIPGSLAEQDRDAAVFWNYIDLRFSSAHEFRIRIEMTTEELIVQFWGHDED
jgi:hypothetical protein